MSKSQKHILQKSKELFQHYGYGKTTLTDIAKSVGKVKSALYYYFSGKEEIFAQIVRDEADVFWKKLQIAVDKGETTQEKMYLYVETRVQLMQKIAHKYGFLKKELFELLPLVQENRKAADIEEKKYIAKLLATLSSYENEDEKIIQFKAELLVNTLKGLEIQMYVTDEVLIDKKSLPFFTDVILNGIL
jgi:AcrR family transcriptional regulator